MRDFMTAPFHHGSLFPPTELIKRENLVVQDYRIIRIIILSTVWSVYEQAYVAALECGDIGLVDECSKLLNKKFPDSVRVKRLLGMQYEYNGEYKKALALYDSLLESNSSNLLLLKRKVISISLPTLSEHGKERQTYCYRMLTLHEMIDAHQVSVYKAQGDLKSAALEIHKILGLIYADPSLWLELADIHMSLGDYKVHLEEKMKTEKLRWSM